MENHNETHIGIEKLRQIAEEFCMALGIPISHAEPKEAVSQFSRIRNLLLQKGMHAFRSVALEEGGIMTYYRHKEFTLTFEIDNDGDVAYLKETGSEQRIADIGKEGFETTILAIIE